MKYLKAIIITCILLAVPHSAFAGMGKAIVAHWAVFNNGSNVQTSNIFISNISKHDLIVTVTLYNYDGTIYSSGIEHKDFQNNGTEIGAGKAGNFKINAPGVGTSYYYGYAVIEWSNKGTDDDIVGLIAWADWWENNPNSYSIQINNGNPF